MLPDAAKGAQGIFYGKHNFSFPTHMNYGIYFIERILNFKDKRALVNGTTGEEITFGHIVREVLNVAASLVELGVRKGDLVAVVSENRSEVLTAILAAMCAGASVTLINSAYTAGEFIHTASITKPKFMFLSPTGYKKHHETLKKLTFVSNILLFGDSSSKEIISYNDLANKEADFTNFVDYYGRVEVALVLYSSGTTGLPKGAKVTHANLIAAAQQHDFCPDKSALTLAPLCNTFGLTTTLKALVNGKMVIHLSRFKQELFLETIQKYKAELHFFSRLPNLRVLQGYGSTETTGPITEETVADHRQGSIGKVVQGIVIKVVDIESRKILGPGEPGEVCVNGVVLFDGYIGKPKSDVFDDDGFYRTGDIAYYDQDGYFFIIDRLKELIKYKAWQVSPAEIEGVLLKHPAVKDAGVIGAPDPLSGELPTAFVVKQQGAEVTENDIIEFVSLEVSPWKLLRGGVRFVSEIPKTGSGKILRRILREMLKAKSKI
ncbi:luciferin 4-monooxygenase-like [Cydia splendana]|uniref:luciferin 4-monooxygenase-like n=1 Tax=Cydia splendana TaxID=1100963 RepID=UPI00300C2DFD